MHQHVQHDQLQRTEDWRQERADHFEGVIGAKRKRQRCQQAIE